MAAITLAIASSGFTVQMTKSETRSNIERYNLDDTRIALRGYRVPLVTARSAK